MTPVFQRWCCVVFALILPHIAKAETVSIFVGPYRMLWEDDTPVAERSNAVADALRKGAESVGYEADLKGACDVAQCLEQAIAEGYDAAAFAETVASDAGYDITIHMNGERKTRLSLTGAFVDVTDKIAAAFKESLVQTIDTVNTVDSEIPTASSTTPNKVKVAPPAPQGLDKPIHRSVFYVGIGLSLGTAGAFAALDVITHRRYEKLARGEEDSAYWETSKSLQLASRICFGVGIGFIVATVTVSPFTAFKHFEKTHRVSFRAIPTGDGGAMILNGRF